MTVIGRYELGEEIGRGGMARVHMGRLVGAVGFSRAVAIKSMHPGLANDASFVRMFIDEARIASHVRHANVVSVLDVVATDGALHLVMEYVAGVPLHRLIGKSPVPLEIARGILFGVLLGLHAAHEARDERGQPLGVIHRDVSPQNVLVGDDGVPRLLDFGVAKAANRLESTGQGQIKGKLGYMSPEQLSGVEIDRRSDLFGATVMAWELLVGKPLFARDSEAATITAVLRDPIPRVATRRDGITAELDELIARGLERDRDARPATALELARALEASGRIAPAHEIAEWMATTRAPASDDGEAEPRVELGTAPLAAHAVDAPVVAPRYPTGGLAVAALPSTTRRSRRRLWTSMGAAAVILAGGGAWWWSSADHASALAPGSATPSVELSGPQPAAGSAAPAAPPPVARTALQPPVLAGSGAPPASAPARPSPPTRRPTVPARVRKPPPAHGATTDCRVVNPDGTIGYKAECLK